MLKHLWRSLIAVRRQARPFVSTKYGVIPYEISALAFEGNDAVGVKIDGTTIKQNADGELFVDLSTFGLSIPGAPR